MFIILGSPRSGTTLLKEALCQNVKITIPRETDFIVPLAFLVDRIKNPEIGRKLIVEMIVSTEAFHRSIGRFLSQFELEDIVKSVQYCLTGILTEIYRKIALKSCSSIAGDKSPNDIGFIAILRKTGLFDSDIKVIHIVRDVRDVILSLKRTSWAPRDVEKYFPRIWSVANLNLRQFVSHNPKSYFFMRFEDFIAEPKFFLTGLCNFLGVDFSSEMLNWPKMGGGLKQLEHHSNLGQDPILERCYGWKLCSSDRCLSGLAKQANEGLAEFGYEI